MRTVLVPIGNPALSKHAIASVLHEGVGPVSSAEYKDGFQHIYFYIPFVAEECIDPKWSRRTMQKARKVLNRNGYEIRLLDSGDIQVIGKKVGL